MSEFDKAKHGLDPLIQPVILVRDDAQLWGTSLGWRAIPVRLAYKMSMQENASDTPRPDQIAERIVDAILAGKLAPGARLGEQLLADLFQVSRTLVREALSRLAARGMVQVPVARRISRGCDAATHCSALAVDTPQAGRRHKVGRHWDAEP